MPSHTIHGRIEQLFPKSNMEDWSEKASEELQGRKAMEFSWKTDDGLVFRPYYDAGIAQLLPYRKYFQLQPSANEGDSTWLSLPKISVVGEKIANDLALSQLRRGAEGLLFDVSGLKSVDLNVLLNGIEWPYCSVSFLANTSEGLLALASYTQEKKYDPAALCGAIFRADPTLSIPEQGDSLFTAPGFLSLGILVPPSSPVNEICEALVKATNLVDKLTDEGFAKELLWQNICLSFTVENDFLMAIAKLKAARLLWYQLARSFEIKSYRPEHLHIHARSVPWVAEKFQPHGNMVKGTMAGLSAVLGGCNTLTIGAEDENNSVMSRVAGNVSHILREEAHMGKVVDPLAGSYAVDVMVDTIAKSAWEAFRKKIKSS